MPVDVQPTDIANEICITGLGVAACLGIDLESIWQRVKRGECGIGPMPALESPLPPGGDGGQAPDLSADFWPDLPREARYLRWTIDAALRDARLNLSDSKSEISNLKSEIADFDFSTRVSLLLGTTLHGMRAGGAFLRTNDFSKLSSFLAGDVIRLATSGLAIDGLCATTCSACSSSLGAIAMAVTLLQSGEADVVIAGGYDAVSEYAYAGFGSLRLISDGPLRSFGKGRAGMKVAEGYGIVVLERRADAERRGATIRAVVAGWGESADAFHLTRPHPEGVGALAAMRQAIARAGIAPAQLDMIAAHATGTIENDNSEAAAITSLLGDASRDVPVVGFKSHLGHTLGGAGAVELALSALAIRDGCVPATANGGEVEYPQLRVNATPLDQNVRYTLNTSLGFGGANTCIVLRTPSASGPSPLNTGERDQSGDVVVISGVGVLVPGAIGNDAFRSLVRAAGTIDGRTIDDAEFESLVPNARRLRRMSTYVKLSICAATLAARDAKLLDSPDLLRDTGAILGSTHGSAGYCYEYYEQVVREGMAAANPMLFAEGVPNAAAAQMSLTLGLTGACQTIIGTRTAGLDALRLAAMRIAAGDADRLIVCAAEEQHHVLDAAYAACGGKPSTSLAVAFVLERRAAAEKRGAHVHGAVGRGAFARGLDSESTPDVLRRASAGLTGIARAISVPTISNGDAFSVEPLLSIAARLLENSKSPLVVSAADGKSVTLLEMI